MRAIPVDEEQGHVALGLALRHLGNTGVFMMATAHPDDENNGLLVQLNRGQGYRTALATATRGNGGQNEIGPEIFEALGVLRTEELAALHRFDGAEQYFTRAVDFGYSFSIDETFEKWGRDEIIADYVRLIRMIRPDVITGMSPAGTGGGQHHQASAVLSRGGVQARRRSDEVSRAAQGRPAPVAAEEVLLHSGRVRRPAHRVPTRILRGSTWRVYDPLLGKTYAEIGTEARSMHKCQGMAQLLALPGPVGGQPISSSNRRYPVSCRRDGDVAFRRHRHEHRRACAVGGRTRSPEESRRRPERNRRLPSRTRRRHSRATRTTRRVQPLLDGPARGPRRCAAGCAPCRSTKAAATTSTSGLRQKETEFQQAILLANARARRGAGRRRRGGPGTAGQGVGRGSRTTVPPNVTVKQVKFSGFDGDAPCTLADGRRRRRVAAAAGRGGAAARAVRRSVVSTLKKAMVARCDVGL